MEKEAQRKVIEFSMLEEENKRLDQQLQLTEQQMEVFHTLRENLDEVSKHKGEFLASIGSGVFLKSEIKDNDKVLINVGEGIMLEKSVEEAKKVIDKQKEKITDIRKEIEQMAAKNFEAMVRIEGDLKKIAEKESK